MKFENSFDVRAMDSAKKVIYLIPFDPKTAVVRDMKTGKACKPSKNAIINCAHEFNQKKVKTIGIDHVEFANAALVENFIAHSGYTFPNGKKADSGSWITALKLPDNLWNYAKEGKIKGVSPAGTYDASQDKLTIEELSLMINETPANKLPVMFMNKEQEMTESKELRDQIEDKSREISGLEKEKEALTAKLTDSENMSKKERKATEGKIDKLTTNIEGLAGSMKSMIDTMNQSNPAFIEAEAEKKKEELIKTIKESGHPNTDAMIAALNTEKGEGGDGDTKIPPKNSPDIHLDPVEMLKKQNEGKPTGEMPQALKDEINQIKADFKKGNQHPMDKYRAIEQAAQRHGYT